MVVVGLRHLHHEVRHHHHGRQPEDQRDEERVPPLSVREINWARKKGRGIRQPISGASNVMSTTYMALDYWIHRRSAVKFLPFSRVRRFKTEYRLRDPAAWPSDRGSEFTQPILSFFSHVCTACPLYDYILLTSK